MAASFTVTITTPDRTVYDAAVLSLVVPAARGYLGILAHHAPLVAALEPGTITCTEPDGHASSFTTGSRGFVEFSENTATILLDTVA